MNVEHGLACDAPMRDAHSDNDDRVLLVANAEKEMGAFLCAVRRRLGLNASKRAGRYWIDAFESAVWPSRESIAAMRRITIAAASRLAHENIASC